MPGLPSLRGRKLRKATGAIAIEIAIRGKQGGFFEIARLKIYPQPTSLYRGQSAEGAYFTPRKIDMALNSVALDLHQEYTGNHR